MFGHQHHPLLQENIAVPAWCMLLLFVAGFFSGGCYPTVPIGDRTHPTDAAADPSSGLPWATTDGEVLPAVAVTDADGRLVEPVIQLGHHAPLQTFQFSPDGRWLLTSARDSQVIQWDAETGDLVRSFSPLSTEHLEMTPDGRWLLLMLRQEQLSALDRPMDSGQASAIPSLISLDTGRVLHPVRELPDGASVRSATLTTDGRYLLLTDTTAGFRPRHRWLWDVRDERFVWSQDVAASSDASDKPFHFERSVRPDGQILVTQSLTARSNAHSPSDLFYAPDGLRAFVRLEEEISSWFTQLWDMTSGELLATWYGEPRPFHFSPDGKQFLCGIGSKIPQIRETATGQVVLEFGAHPEIITALAYSPDGDTVMSGSKDGSLQLWHVASGRLLRGGVLRKGSVGSIAYSPDARRALVATGGNGAFLFDLRSGKLIRRVGEPRTANSWERHASAAFSPDGRRILTRWQGVTWDAFKASLWDAETGNLLRDLCEIPVARGRRDLNPITISPDGRWGISAAGYLHESGLELLLWDLETSQIVHRFDQHLAGRVWQFWDHERDWPVTSAGVRLQGWRDGPSASSDIRIAFPKEVREVLPSIEGLPDETKRWLESFILPTPGRWPLVLEPGASGVMSPCGRRGAARASRWAGPLTIHDLDPYAPLHEVGPSRPRCAAFSPDGARLLIDPITMPAGRHQSGVELWEVDSGEPAWQTNLERLEVVDIRFSPGGRYVALMSRFQRRAVVLDALDGKIKIEADGLAVFCPKDKRVAFLGNSHMLWDIESATMIQDFGRHSPINRLVFSPNGRSLWLRIRGRTGLYCAATGELLHETGEPMTNRSGDWNFGLDGARFVTWSFGSPRQPAALWDFENARKVTDLLDAEGQSISRSQFTPDGRKLVAAVATEVNVAKATAQNTSAGLTQRVYQSGLIVWDAETGAIISNQVADVDWTSSRPGSIEFTPDGRHLLTIHAQEVILWDIGSGRPLHVFREPGASTLRVSLSPDGRLLLTTVPGSRATLWELATGEKLREFEAMPVIANGRSPSVWTVSCEFSRDGQRIISRSHYNRGIHQMSVETGQLIGGFYLLGNGDQAVAYTPDGGIAATSPGLVRYREPGTNRLLPEDD